MLSGSSMANARFMNVLPMAISHWGGDTQIVVLDDILRPNTISYNGVARYEMARLQDSYNSDDYMLGGYYNGSSYGFIPYGGYDYGFGGGYFSNSSNPFASQESLYSNVGGVGNNNNNFNNGSSKNNAIISDMIDTTSSSIKCNITAIDNLYRREGVTDADKTKLEQMRKELKVQQAKLIAMTSESLSQREAYNKASEIEDAVYAITNKIADMNIALNKA